MGLRSLPLCHVRRWSACLGGNLPAAARPQGYRWRTVLELNVNQVWLYVYSEPPAGHRIRVWYDDVVVR